MAQVWFRNNKAAQKWTEPEVEAIFEDVYKWIREKDGLVLMGEVELYMLETHGVCQTTRISWINNIYKNNKSIALLWNYILQLTENKLVRDNSELRPSIQAMVLQNKHNYREKKDIESQIKVSQMGDIVIGGKKLDINIGEDKPIADDTDA